MSLICPSGGFPPGLDVGPAGVDPLPGQELLHRVADHELGERLAALGWGAALMTAVGAPMAKAPSVGQMVWILPALRSSHEY